MKQVVDHFGEKVVGLFKKEDGSLVVSNKLAFDKSILEKKRVDEITELKDRLSHMEKLIQQLIGSATVTPSPIK